MRNKKIRTSNWTDLPGELVEEILRRLNFVDVARAKCVCSGWRCASPPPTPWLFVPPDEGLSVPGMGKGKGVSHLYNPADAHLHRTKTTTLLPDEFNKRTYLIGSSRGCLIGLAPPKFLVPFVLNPLTGTRFSLPSVDNLIPCADNSLSRRHRIKKVAIITTELDGTNWVAVLLYQRQHQDSCCTKLAACSLSDDSWTELGGSTKPKWYYDVCSSSSSTHGNMNIFFALTVSFTIEIWDSKPPFHQVRTIHATRPEFELGWANYLLSTRPEINYKKIKKGLRYSHEIKVELSYSRIYLSMPLLVLRKVDYKMGRPRTMGFEVYKMDEPKENWVKAESLGGSIALFLGQGSDSISVPATGGIMADCIYYSEDCWSHAHRESHGALVFNLRDGNIRQLYGTNDWYGIVWAKWIVPRETKQPN